MKYVLFGSSPSRQDSGGLERVSDLPKHVATESKAGVWLRPFGFRTWDISVGLYVTSCLMGGKLNALIWTEVAQLQNEVKGNILSCVLGLGGCVVPS